MQDLQAQVIEIKESWMGMGIQLSEAPSENAVRAFWNKLGAGEVPGWFLHLMITTGGMNTSGFTDTGFRFWDFESIIHDGEVVIHGERYRYFADHDIGIWFLALRIIGDGAIYAVDFEKKVFKLFDDLEAFLSALATDSVMRRIYDSMGFYKGASGICSCLLKASA